jgi:hypothetical protein
MKTLFKILILMVMSTNISYGKCASWTSAEKELVNRASSILVARITSAKIEYDKYGFINIYGQYETLKIIKGKYKQHGEVTSSLTDVGLPLTPGFIYLLFIDNANSVDGCTGSHILNDFLGPAPNPDLDEVARLEKLVKESRKK